MRRLLSSIVFLLFSALLGCWPYVTWGFGTSCYCLLSDDCRSRLWALLTIFPRRLKIGDGAHTPTHAASQKRSSSESHTQRVQTTDISLHATSCPRPGSNRIRLVINNLLPKPMAASLARALRWFQPHHNCAAQPPSTKACSARSTARPSAAALFTVSSYSDSGTESATSPAPACVSK